MLTLVHIIACSDGSHVLLLQSTMQGCSARKIGAVAGFVSLHGEVSPLNKNDILTLAHATLHVQ